MRRRWRRGILGLGWLVTGLCALLLLSCLFDELAIDDSPGHATAEVLSTSFSRTAVSYTTPDGTAHIPEAGVQYPSGLRAGDLVRVEYDAENPKLVRVAGRGVLNAVPPVLSSVAGTWVVLLAAWWPLREGRSQRTGRPVNGESP